MRQILVWFLLGALARCAWGEQMQIDLSRVAETNIPRVVECVHDGAFHFISTEAAPPGAPFFFIRYTFTVPLPGLYRLWITGPGPGASACSRYSFVVDGGTTRPVLRTQIIADKVESDPHGMAQDLLSLTAGAHTVEFRFAPEQRMRVMNRVKQPFAKHDVTITAVAVVSVAPTPRQPRVTSRQALPSGASIVLFGDSITEEALYGRHFVRLLRSVYPERSITVYNAGISLNRTWEALARVDADVVALHPTWAVLAFGVNDCVHMPPDEFASNYDALVVHLQKAGIHVLCTTPSGMLPAPDANGQYFHTPDRAQALDRTITYEAGAVLQIAHRRKCPCADVLGAFTRAGFSRSALMGSQWHPNNEGGRVFALTLLRALGVDAPQEAGRVQPADTAVFSALARMPSADYPTFGVTPFVHRTTAAPYIVATSYSQNAVYAFTPGGQPVACVPVGHHPMGIVYSTRRRELYVACEGSGRIDIIALPDFTLAGSIMLGEEVYPVALTLSGDEQTIWTGNFFGCGVSQVDLSTRKVIRNIPLGSLVEGVALSADEDVVMAATRDNIAFISARDGGVRKREHVSDYAAAFYRDVEGRLFVIDTATWAMARIDGATEHATPSAAAPFSARALAADAKTGAIWAGDCQGNRLMCLLPTSNLPQPVAAVECPLGVAVVP